MADDYIGLDEPGTIDKKVDTESLTIGLNTVHRGRIRVAGAGAADLVPADAANGLDVDVTRVSGTVAVSAVSLPLPTGASTAVLQTQPGVDIGDVTVNNAAGASAVNVQDGGNTLTVDGPTADNSANPTAKLSVLAGVASAAAVVRTEGNVVPLRTSLQGDLVVSLDGESIFVNNSTLRVDAPVGTPVATRLSDGAAFYDATKTGQLPTALVGGRLDANVGAWLNSVAPSVGQKTQANSIPVVLASDSIPTVQAVGDVDHDVANTLKVIQIGGNASPTDVPPAVVSANTDRVRAWLDRSGAVVVRRRKLRESYTAVFRLAETTARLDQSFTQVANTTKQWATLHHTAGATKEVRLMKCSVFLTVATTAIIQGVLELRQISAAPATGNPAITPTPHRRGGTAAEAVGLYLPTTQGTEANVNSPLAHLPFDYGIMTATASTVNPLIQVPELVLYDASQEDDEEMPPVLPVATLDGWGVCMRTVNAPVLRMTILMRFTEEIP